MARPRQQTRRRLSDSSRCIARRPTNSSRAAWSTPTCGGRGTPGATHAEVAFLLDSTAAGSDHYGFELEMLAAGAWRHGPQRTAGSARATLNAPPAGVWNALYENLVRTNVTPILDWPPSSTTSLYLDELVANTGRRCWTRCAARFSTVAYLGYIDCSTWTHCFFRPCCFRSTRFATAMRSSFQPTRTASPHITPPTRDHGFGIVGVEQTLYGVVLEQQVHEQRRTGGGFQRRQRAHTDRASRRAEPAQ